MPQTRPIPQAEAAELRRWLALAVVAVNLVVLAIAVQCLLFSRERTEEQVRRTTANLAGLVMGIGLLLPNATAAALEPVPQAAGFAAGIVGTAQIGLASVTTMLAAALYAGSAAAMTGVMTAAGALTVLGYSFGRGRTRGR